MYRGIATAAALAAAVCFCAVTFPSRVAAQQKQIPPELNGHAVVSEIVLPPELETEKPATLAVINSDGMLAEGVMVLLPGGRKVTTDSSGRARFVVTSDPGAFVAEIAATSLQPRVRAYSTVRAHPAEYSASITISKFPRVLVHDQPGCVTGYGFRGDAELDTATVGGKAAMILAASPMGIVFQMTHESNLGPAALIVGAAGIKHPPQAVTIVSVELSRPSGPLEIGKVDELFARVAGTEQKVILAVENLTPGVVELTAGNFHWVMSSGGVLNEAPIGMRARSGGDFSVSVRVAHGGNGVTDLNVARRELLAAHGLAEDAWVGRTDRAFVRMDQAEKNPRNIPKLRQEIEKMLAENPPADVKRHLQLAWVAVSQSS